MTGGALQHRISAGVLCEHEGRLLMVRHRREGHYDFWVAPGGGVQGAEALQQAAAREAREETGLDVAVGALAYIEELMQPGLRHVKFWFVARLLGGTLDVSHPDTRAEFIVQAAWLDAAELARAVAFPPVLTQRYAQDRAQGFAAPVHLPLRQMQFW